MEVNRRTWLEGGFTGACCAVSTIAVFEVAKRVIPIEEQAEKIAQSQGAAAFHIVIKDADGVRERHYEPLGLRDFNVCVLSDAEKQIIDRLRKRESDKELI